MRLHICAIVGAAWFSTVQGAAADPLFPDVLKNQLHTPCAPDCTLCHNNDFGNYNNRRPGAIIYTWTANYGLDPRSTQSLVDSFKAAEGDMLDTDHDGIPDTTELLSGSDPDDPTPGAQYKCRLEPPVYGCVRVARQAPIDDVAALAGVCAAAVGFAALRRRIARRAAR